jgi:hypothetical protein
MRHDLKEVVVCVKDRSRVERRVQDEVYLLLLE